MSNQERSEKETAEAVYAFAAEKMKGGASGPQVQAMLIQSGLDRDSAAVVVANLTRMRCEAVRAAGKKNMASGALWCIGGIVITVATYDAASPGGRYVIAWGAIVFGAIQFFRGLIQSQG
jgi:hypothetical protein